MSNSGEHGPAGLPKQGGCRSSARPRCTAPTPDAHPTWRTSTREHFNRVVAAVELYGVPARDSPDIAPDVFVQVHKSLPRYDPTLPFGRGLKTITYRTARDALRVARRFRLRRRTQNGVDTIDMRANPERSAELTQMKRLFILLLQELTDDQREVYLMSVVDEIQSALIAAVLGEQENTVRSSPSSRAPSIRHCPLLASAPPRVVRRLSPAHADVARRGGTWGAASREHAGTRRSRLTRVLGMGILGMLAPLSAPQIAAAALFVFTLGGVAGAALLAALQNDAPTEQPAHAEAHIEVTASGSPLEASNVTATPSTSASASASATAPPPTSRAASNAVDPSRPCAPSRRSFRRRARPRGREVRRCAPRVETSRGDVPGRPARRTTSRAAPPRTGRPGRTGRRRSLTAGKFV